MYREEEIIMPDEHQGEVRENYQWKVLCRYIHVYMCLLKLNEGGRG